MKTNTLLTAIIVFFLCSSIKSQRKYIDWNLAPSPKFIDVSFVQGNSPNDFWLFDRMGILYHFENNQWKDYPISRNTSLVRYKTHFIDNQKLLLSAADSLWRAHIYLFSNKKWRYLTQLDYVVNNILQLKNNVFLLGDWGSVVEYSNKKFTVWKTPFRNHILASMCDGKLIWMGVRGEGIFSFDGEKFRHYEIEGGDQIEIVNLDKNSNGKICIKSGKFDNYILKDGLFRRTEAVENPSNLNSNSRFSSYRIPQIKLTYTHNNIDVSSKYIYKEHFQFPDGEILLITGEQKIYFSNELENNFFEDNAMIYRVKGYENNSGQGAAFFYFNNDLLPDLFVINNFPEIFSNKIKAPFYSTDGLSNYPAFTGGGKIIIGDITNDNLPDIITTKFANNGPYIEVYPFGAKEKISILSEPDDGNAADQRAFENINLADINSDGLLDLDISLYLGKEFNAGHQAVVENNGYGKFSNIKNLSGEETKGFNVQTIQADFNNDNLTDWLIIGRWKPLNLLIKKNNSEYEFEQMKLPGDTLNAFVGGLSADFNNDGFLDIVATSDKKLISFFLNIRGEKFIEISDIIGFREWNKTHYSRTVRRSMNSGDFNNDGFTDLLVTIDAPLKSENLLFVNENGIRFHERSREYKINEPFANGTIIGDIDSDGDLDIFGYRDGFNSLWINNKNDKNYLCLIPKGVKSNSEGIGARIEIYKSGFLNNSDSLVGVHQIGAGKYGKNQQNQILAHFGLPAEKHYDISVKFAAGEIVELKNIAAGQTIVIHEMEGLSAFIYKIPRTVMTIVLNRNIQFYFFVILISMIFLFFGMKYGIKNYKWSPTISLLIVIVDISIFWIILILTYSSEIFVMKFLLPLFLSISGILLPLLIFSTLRKSVFYKKSESELEEELLKLIMQFIHGEWALRNISGLLLLFQNFPDDKSREAKFYELLNERTATFHELTKPILYKVVQLTKLLGLADNKILLLNSSIKKIEFILSAENISSINRQQQNELIYLFQEIKDKIREIKENVFASFSSSPEKVISEISAEYASVPNIQIQKFKNYETERIALIKAEELGIVIDNCIQNSIRAFKGKAGLIEIFLSWEAPRIIIDIKDNGLGIANENWNKIFESGFSENSSTGTGLTISKILVEKYNGKIFVKESSEQKGTTICISLNEGIK